MPLERYPVIFNTSVKFKKALPLDEAAVMQLLNEVLAEIPEMDDFRRGDSTRTEAAAEKEYAYSLTQRGTGRDVRQLVLTSQGVVLAVAPPLGVADADRTARLLYPLVSGHLKPNPLLVDYLDISFRFEFPYKGNHSHLILTNLFGNTPFAQLAHGIDGAVVNFEPTINLTISEDHSIAAMVEIQSATSGREIESQDYDGDAIRVLCGIAKVRGLAGTALEQVYDRLFSEATSFVTERVVKTIVEKLDEAVSSSVAE